MIYQAYQMCHDLLQPSRFFARSTLAALNHVGSRAWPGLGTNDLRSAVGSNGHGPDQNSDLRHPESMGAQRKIAAACEVFLHSAITHVRPAFGIASVHINGSDVAVHEDIVQTTAFARLIRFRKSSEVLQPRVLLVAPMSGHFATLLRETVRTLLVDHDVYITDWANARDVPLIHGRFGFDEYVSHLIAFLMDIGPGAHVMAVCQPCVAALAAVAVMAEDEHPAQPRSMTLMAGPIDCRVSPTQVNTLATKHPIEWFERNLIATVPWRHPGAMRRVYPGFLQLSAFMSMNLERHKTAFADLYRHLAAGETERAQAIRDFYDEYLAVADLPAEFYLDTVRQVFQDYALPLGTLEWQGRRVKPGAIRRTALLTVEGERDDICAIGQTMAAHELCSGIRPYLKQHYMQPGVGHYGVFNGKRWQQQIYPIVRDMIHQTD